MKHGRWTRLETYGARSDEDLDSSMCASLERESVEVLRHQLEVERERGAAMQRSDALWAIGVFAASFGLGVGVGAFKPKHMPKWVRNQMRGSKK